MRRLILVVILMIVAVSGDAQTITSSVGPLKITKMLGGLKTPWGIGFLPNGDYLVTERGGTLFFVSQGRSRRVKGTPKVYSRGQGGLLDVMIPRDFSTSRQVFLTYSRPQSGAKAAGTALAVGRLSDDGQSLSNLTSLFEAAPGGKGGAHFGSRVVEAGDGTLFITLGERGNRPSAQDRSNHNGSIVRINRDGSVPADNPFVGQPGVRPEIWSFGHRNPQGADLDQRGNLWTAEHGPKGGDEVNLIRKGANYGWPVISYGVHYSGKKIGQGTSKPGLQQPQFNWDPSIAPSSIMIYSGALWPEWRGDMFVGSLKFNNIHRLTGRPLQASETFASPETKRVRDVVEAPDGSIWFLSIGKGAVYRLSPG